MEIKVNIQILKPFKVLRPFFEEPRRNYFIREIAKMIGINHTTVGQHLRYYEKEGVIARIEGGIYPSYSAVLSKKFFNMKLFYNLEKLRESGLIESLQDAYDLPVIVLFGSYARAMDDSSSDIDICVISNVNREVNTLKYEKYLNRKVSIHRFSKERWENLKSKNKEMVNNICNGLVLSGQLEVL